MTRISDRAALVVVLAFMIASLLTATYAGATAQHAAGLVVDTGDRVVTVYVEFSEETITGEELLRRADVDAVFSDEYGMGKAVCSILGVGSPQDDCFREAERNGLYWNYSRAEDGGWQRSNRGVSSTTVEHGDVDGWAWGEQGSQPPYYSFEEIRRQHAPEPSPTPSSPTPSDPPPDEGEAPPSSPDRTPTTAPPTVVADPATPSPPATREPSDEAAVEATPETDPSTTSSPDRGDRTADEPSPTPTTDAILATDETTDPSRSPVALLLFVAVMVGLVGAIVWRRRTGTTGAGGGR